MPRILVWPAGGPNDATSVYRLLWPAQALAAQGADIHIDRAGPTVYWDKPWTGDQPPPDARVLGVQKPDADVVVMQRPGRRWWADIIPFLHELGVRTVVDVDDDFTAIDPRNRAWADYQPHTGAHHSWQHITRACQLADLVTVTTPALAQRYGQHGRVRILPNLVPAAYLSISPDTLDRTVGWAGSTQTHPGDLESARGGIATAVREHAARFHIIGTGEGVPEALGLDEVSAVGWVPLAEYPHELARLEIGVVPLADSTFNRAKSALKMGEMAALGVAVVASPTPDNRRLHRMGVGLLASRSREWASRLGRLLAEPERRRELAERGREVMSTQTYESHADRWADAWLTREEVKVA